MLQHASESFLPSSQASNSTYLITFTVPVYQETAISTRWWPGFLTCSTQDNTTRTTVHSYSETDGSPVRTILPAAAGQQTDSDTYEAHCLQRARINDSWPTKASPASVHHLHHRISPTFCELDSCDVWLSGDCITTHLR